MTDLRSKKPLAIGPFRIPRYKDFWGKSLGWLLGFQCIQSPWLKCSLHYRTVWHCKLGCVKKWKCYVGVWFIKIYILLLSGLSVSFHGMYNCHVWSAVWCEGTLMEVHLDASASSCLPWCECTLMKVYLPSWRVTWSDLRSIQSCALYKNAWSALKRLYKLMKADLHCKKKTVNQKCKCWANNIIIVKSEDPFLDHLDLRSTFKSLYLPHPKSPFMLHEAANTEQKETNTLIRAFKNHWKRWSENENTSCNNAKSSVYQQPKQLPIARQGWSHRLKG